MALREPFPGFPPPLTTRPEGLLSMLGLQTNGSYPQHLAYDQLIPQLDLLPWYYESRAEIQSRLGLSLGSGGPGTFIQAYQVPANEVWVLLNFTVQPTSVPTPCEIQLCRTRANDQLSRIALSPVEDIAGTRLALIGSDSAIRYLIFRPTVEIGIQWVSGSGAGNVVNTCLRFVRCTI